MSTVANRFRHAAHQGLLKLDNIASGYICKSMATYCRTSWGIYNIKARLEASRTLPTSRRAAILAVSAAGTLTLRSIRSLEDIVHHAYTRTILPALWRLEGCRET